jgi:uncharacterized membrane protein YidH (DUF202 family)
MTIDEQGSRAAGWYPDPLQQQESRYWDGSTWTEHVANQGVSAVSALGANAQGVSVGVAASAKHSPAGRAKSRAVLILIGGGLMALGALLPWETVTAVGTSQSVQGTSEGAGGIVLVSGGVIALLAFLFLNATVKRKASIATLILSAVSFVFAAGNWSAISDDIDKAKQAGAGVVNVDANIGIGLITAVVGCLMAAIASFLLLRQKDIASAE